MEEPRTLAAKINVLFALHRRPDGREFTNEDVARGVRLRGGPVVSASYLWQLRHGTKDNPTFRHIAALADFFAVEPNYFFDAGLVGQARGVDELAPRLRDPAVRRLVGRALDLPPADLLAAGALVERLRALQGLPADLGPVPGAGRSGDIGQNGAYRD